LKTCGGSSSGGGEPEDRFREDPCGYCGPSARRTSGAAIPSRRKRGPPSRAAPEIFRSIPGERVVGELLLSLSANPQDTIEDLRLAGILAILLPEVALRDRRFGRVRRRYAILQRSLGRPMPETPLLANLLVDAAQEECGARMRKTFPKGRRRGMPALAKEDEKRIFRLSRTEAIARRLHFPRIRGVVRMLEDLARLAHADRMRNRHARIEAIFGRWETPDGLLSLYRADCKTSGREKAEFRPILRRAVRQPPILSGKDLLKRGIPAAPRMEEILEEVREATLTGRVKSRKEGMNRALAINNAGTTRGGYRRRVNPRARKAITPAGDPAGTRREGGRKNPPEKTPRHSPDRSG
jgi:hypothetical protein